MTMYVGPRGKYLHNHWADFQEFDGCVRMNTNDFCDSLTLCPRMSNFPLVQHFLRQDIKTVVNDFHHPQL